MDDASASPPRAALSNRGAALIRRLLDDATPAAVRARHAAHIDPELIRLLPTLGYGRDFVRAEGSTLWDSSGRAYVDMLAGYGAVPLGHNHPEVRAAVEETLAAGLPAFHQIGPHALSGALAERLTRVAPPGLDMVCLLSTGSESVDGALKLARIVTTRAKLVGCERGFHGTTLGALSVTGRERHRTPFEPLLDGTLVPFGDLGALEKVLRKRDVAAFVVEPLQGEGGVRPAPPGYLAGAAKLCRRFGTLLVVDEVATGLGRTGWMFACEAEGVLPDVLVVGKGLSGGAVPVAGYLTRRKLWERAYGSPARHDLHCSTYGGGPLACAAALATIEVITRDNLCARAQRLGERLGVLLRLASGESPLVRVVRGRGLFWGVELKAEAPIRALTFGAVDAVADAVVPQWIAAGLMQRGFITQVTTQVPDVLRVQPPLTVEEADLKAFGDALAVTLHERAQGAVTATVDAATEAVKGAVSRLLGGKGRQRE